MRRCLVMFLTAFLLSLNALVAIPVVTDLQPTVAGNAGGTTITIYGKEFTSATSVMFGNTPATSFTVDSDSIIKAISPPHVPQVSSVIVTTPSGTSITSTNSYFTFQGNILAYVANAGSNSVSIIDTSTNTVIKTLTVPDGPLALNILPDGSLIYVADTSELLTGTTVSVISGALQNIINTLNVDEGPDSVGVTFNGQQAYVVNTNAAPGTVSAINTHSNAITNITVGNAPNSVTITPDSSKAIIANYFDNDVQIIDTGTNIAGAPISTGSQPSGAAVTPDGSQAYVVNTDPAAGLITAINLNTNVATNINVIGFRPTSLAITPDGTKVYSASSNSVGHPVNIISTATNTVIDTILGFVNANGVVINKAGTNAYISSQNHSTGPGAVSVITTSNDAVIATIPTGVSPNAINISPDNTQVYVACANDGTVTVVDTTTNTFKKSIPVGSTPTMVVFAPDQAPLAKFAVNVAPPGQESVFDASASVSPTGTITNYAWDFGDGATFNTNNPVTYHTYNAFGSFTVTLMVTNSAGTSTTQIINYSTNNSNFITSLSMPLTNNGGPTAETSEEIVILAPPSHFIGIIKKNKFLNKTECILKAKWDASPSVDVVLYQIYKNNNAVKEVLATSPLVFETCLPHCSAEGFEITAVNSNGIESAPIPMQIEHE